MKRAARAILLCAGRGTRFRPVTERIPKPLLPYLNVALASAHLRRLEQAGIREVAVNLHHLGDQVERHLRQEPPRLLELSFFPEPRILGTAGALRNAAEFLSGGDFLVVNSDAAIAADFAGLLACHRASGRPATLLLAENRDPDYYTPLQTEGNRVTGFGGHGPPSLLYTGVCALAPRVLARIPPGETSLVAHLWQPLLDEGIELGWVLHDGPFDDLGRPGDFLRASLEALESGGPFPEGGGEFDGSRRVLFRSVPAGLDARNAVLGRATIGRGVRVRRCAVWDDVSIADGVRLADCVVARGRVPAGADYQESLLWADDPGGIVAPHPLDGFGRTGHRVQPLSPRR